MREIKFRAWDKQNEVWEYSTPMPDYGFWKWVQYDSTTIFSEYTGLHDRNGREIYEGDILRWTINIATEIAPVIFEHGSFWMGKNQNGFEVCNDWLRGEYEVLGNIYESPELLK